MEDSFEQFVQTRSAALARTAYLLTGDRHAAEDLLQDALARVAQRWRTVTHDDRDPEAYVRRVLYHRAVDGWRYRQRRPEVLALLAGLMAVSLLPLAGELRSPPPADGGEAGVSDYPERIGRQWWVRDLPDQPGPVAGLVKVAVEVGYEWHALSERGHRWRVPGAGADSYPTISPDGRYLGYLAEQGWPYVLHDLVSGEQVSFDASRNSGYPQTRYALHGQSPSFWSPDGARVAVQATDTLDNVDGLLVLDVDGGTTWLPIGQGEDWLGHPAGWVADDAVAMLHWTAGESPEPVVAQVEVRVVGLDGRVRRGVPLAPAWPWRAHLFHQWSGKVSPDGSRLLLVEDDQERNRLLRVFTLADGVEVDEPVQTGPDVPTCPATWAGAEPAVPYQHDRSQGAVTAVPDRRGDEARLSEIVVAGIASECLIWAPDAIAQAPKDGLLALQGDHPWLWPWRELQYVWWTWFWREILLAALLGAGASAGWHWWRRRRASYSGG